jgi:hypothetical protein
VVLAKAEWTIERGASNVTSTSFREAIGGARLSCPMKHDGLSNRIRRTRQAGPSERIVGGACSSRPRKRVDDGTCCGGPDKKIPPNIGHDKHVPPKRSLQAYFCGGESRFTPTSLRQGKEPHLQTSGRHESTHSQIVAEKIMIFQFS